MLLTKLKVVNLYKDLNYELNFDTSTRSSFIVGRNGCGKTTLLKGIDALAQGNLNYFKAIFFKSFQFEFNDDTKIIISKLKSGTLKIEITENGKKKSYNINDEPYDLGTVDKLIERLISLNILKELSCGHWSSKENTHITSEKEILDNYKHLVYKVPDQIEKFIDKLNVNFLSSERQLIESGAKKKNQTKKYKVEEIAEDLKKRLQKLESSVLKNIEKISDDLEETLLTKGLSGFDSPTPKQFESDFQQYLEFRKRLSIANLAAGTDLDPDISVTPQKAERAIIDYIIKKRIDAYKPYNDILEKLELFTEIINSALTRKNVNVKLPEGMNIVTESGDTFHPVHLSSGEQQVAVLAHTLLFEIKNGGLALIDEPELSMDVDWQSRLSGWLDKVGEACNLRFILATHSPLLLMGREDSIKTLNV